jgi:hypothetical protein
VTHDGGDQMRRRQTSRAFSRRRLCGDGSAAR